MKKIIFGLLLMNIATSFAGECKFGKRELGMWDLHKIYSSSLMSCLESASRTFPQTGRDYNYKITYKNNTTRYKFIMKISELECLVLSNINPIENTNNHCLNL